MRKNLPARYTTPPGIAGFITQSTTAARHLDFVKLARAVYDFTRQHVRIPVLFPSGYDKSSTHRPTRHSVQGSRVPFPSDVVEDGSRFVSLLDVETYGRLNRRTWPSVGLPTSTREQRPLAASTPPEFVDIP